MGGSALLATTPLGHRNLVFSRPLLLPLRAPDRGPGFCTAFHEPPSHFCQPLSFLRWTLTSEPAYMSPLDVFSAPAPPQGP